MELTAIIVAGGKSTRMGKDKALLPLEGKPVIENIVTRIQAVTSNVLIVSNDENAYSFLGVPIIHDVYRDQGPLAGIHAGLVRSKTEWNIVCACDMPFVSVDAANYLLSVAKDMDAVVPIIDGNFHPLFAIYKKSLLPQLEAQLTTGSLKMKDFLNLLNVRYVNEEELFSLLGKEEVRKIFFNMNHPEQYEDARKMSRD